MQNITGIQEKFRLKSAIISKNNFLGHSCNFLIKINSEFSNEEIIHMPTSSIVSISFNENKWCRVKKGKSFQITRKS